MFIYELVIIVLFGLFIGIWLKIISIILKNRKDPNFHINDNKEIQKRFNILGILMILIYLICGISIISHKLGLNLY